MLRFPSTHAYFQFAGYPGYFEQMSGVLNYIRRKIPHVLHSDDPCLRVVSGPDDFGAPTVEDGGSSGKSIPALGRIGFWPGFSGGGLLALPLEIPLREQGRLILDCIPGGVAMRRPYGTWLGNLREIDRTAYTAGDALVQHVTCVEPPEVPALAVRYGLAQKVPRPRVKVTIEHLSQIDDERWLLVVPRGNRESPLKLHERLPEWFAHFGVTLGPPQTVSAEMRAMMKDWFDDVHRAMILHRLQGGSDDAGWLLGVVNYVADNWSIQSQGLDCVHLLGAVEREPGFRRYWTSNR